jgi:hypothetical protein
MFFADVPAPMIQTRTRLSTLAVVLLVALAGCSGGAPAADPGTTATTPGDAAAGTTTTATPSPSAGPTTATATPTTGDDSPPDSSVALTAHEDALEVAGSYTVTYEFSTDGPTANALTGVSRVDTTRDSQYTRYVVSSGDQTIEYEQYREPGADVVYTRIALAGQASYLKQPFAAAAGVGDLRYPYAGGAADAEMPPEFRYEGTVDTPDGPRDRYVVDSPEQLNDGTVAGGEVVEASIVVLVDPDTGIASEFDYSLTSREDGRTVTSSYRLRYSDVGATTVTAPAWLDAAEAATP